MKLHLVFTILILSLGLAAQDISLIESEELDDNKMVNIAPVKIDGGYIALVVRYNENNVRDPKMHPTSTFNDPLNYSYIEHEKDIYLQKLDEDLNIVAEHKIDVKDAHDINLYGMLEHEGKVKAYYSKRKNFNKEVFLCEMTIDTDKLKRNKERTIHSVKYKKGVPASKFIISPDSTKLSFISDRLLGDKDERKLDISIFTIQGTPLWDDGVYFGDNTEKLTIGDAALDNTGNLYVSYKLYEKYYNKRSKKNNDGKRVPTYKTKIIAYGVDGTEAIVTLQDEDKFIRRCDLIYHPATDAIIALGSYSIKDGGNLTGIYTCSIDTKKLESAPITYYQFDKELIDLIDEDGFGQTNEKDPGIEVRDLETSIHIKDNGDIAYIMQPFKYDEYTSVNGVPGQINTGTITYRGYNAYSIVVAQIEKSKAIFTRIPRKAESRSPFPAIIAKTVYADNQIYIIYTDYYKNLNREITKKPKKIKDPMQSSLIVANVDQSGNFNRSFLKNREEEGKFTLSLEDMHAINSKEFMYNFYTGGFFSSKRLIGILSFTPQTTK